MNRYLGSRRLDGQQQSARLLAALPMFRQTARGNPFVWEGTLRPTELSADYWVRITYQVTKRRPQVEVLEPKLVIREKGVPIPHVFPSGALCLHVPSDWEPSMYIHQTIVPWTSLWLYYYEIWHATGEWMGGGHTPAGRKDADLAS